MRSGRGRPLRCGGFLLDAGAAFLSELEWVSTGLWAMMGRISVMRDEHGRGMERWALRMSNHDLT